MYNPNEDKRENENNMEPIHGYRENEREEKAVNENEYTETASYESESREAEENMTAEAVTEQPQQTYQSETLRDYTPEDAQPTYFDAEAEEKTESTTSVYHLSQPMTVDYSGLDSFVIYICMEGSCTIKDDRGNAIGMQAGESVLFPATTRSLEVTPHGEVKFLETYV